MPHVAEAVRTLTWLEVTTTTVVDVGVAGLSDIEAAMRFAVASGIRPWTQVRPLDEAAEAFASLRDGRVRFRAVLQP